MPAISLLSGLVPGVGARVEPVCGLRQPAKEMLPAHGVDGCLLRRKAAMNKPKPGPLCGRSEGELDLGGAPRRYPGTAHDDRMARVA